MAVAGHPRRMKMCRSSGRRRRFLGAESPLISLTWEPRAPALLPPARDPDSSGRGCSGWQRSDCRGGGGEQVETLVERCAAGRGQGLGDRRCAGARPPRRAPRRDPQVHHDDRRAGLLAQWLASFGVTRVGMESTGCYWNPVWQLLEGQLECWLLNAAHLHNVPGRKTDVADAAWIAQLVEHGLVRPSFEPPRPIRSCASSPATARPRPKSAAGRSSGLDKVLQDAGIQAVQRGHRRPGRLRPGDAGSPGRRHPRPGGAGRVGQGPAPEPSCRRCGRPWLAGSAPTTTGCSSPRSWPTSTTWTRPSPRSRRGSSRYRPLR